LKALGVFSGLIIIAVIVGVVFNFFGSRSNASDTSQFLTYLGLFNLYVYLLTFIYLPAPHAASTQGVVGMTKLKEEKEFNNNVGGVESGGKEHPSSSAQDPSADEMDVIFLDDALKSNM